MVQKTGAAHLAYTYYVEYWVECDPGETGAVWKRINGEDIWFDKDESLSQKVTLTQNWYNPLDWFSNPDLFPKALSSLNNVASDGNGKQASPFRFFYARNRYTLSFNTQGGNGIASVPNVAFGTPLAEHQPEDPARTQFVFDGWHYDAEGKKPADLTADTMPDRNLTLFAKWEPTECIVKFYDSYGGNLIAEKGVFKGGYVDQNDMALITLDGVTLAKGASVPGRGTFEGWYLMVGGRSTSEFNPGMAIYNDLTLFARWRTAGFTVTYDPGEGTGSAPIDNTAYDIGARIRLKTPYGVTPPAGQVFLGWKCDLDGKTYYPGQLLVIGGQTNLTAVYGSGLRTLTFTPGYEGATEPPLVWSASAGQSLRLPDKNLFSRAGERLVGWKVVEGGAPGEFAPGAAYTCPDSDVTLAAVWSGPDRTVTFTAGENGRLSGRAEFANIPNNALWESRIIVPAPKPDAGYFFAGWEPALPKDGTPIDSDMTFNAVFKAKTPLVITVVDKSWPYDGIRHSTNETVFSTPLPEDEKIGITFKNDPGVTNVSDGIVMREIDYVKITRWGWEGDRRVITNVTQEYDITLVAGEMSITPIAASVTPAGKDKPLGTDDPALTATASGFLAESHVPTYTLSREAGESIGEYAIGVATHGDNPNYTIDWGTGVFTIGRNTGLPAFTVEASSLAAAYTGNQHAVDGYTVNGGATLPDGFVVKALVSGASATNVVPTDTAGDRAADRVNKITSVDITFNGHPIAAEDVEVVPIDGALTVTPIAATVAVDSGFARRVGEADPAFTATAGGFLDAAHVPAYDLTREAGEGSGSYAITFANQGDNPNYDITWTDGTLAISANRDLRINVRGNSLTATYDGTRQGPSGFTATLGDDPLPASYDVVAKTSDPAATNVAEVGTGLRNEVLAVTQISINGYPLNDGDVTIATAPGMFIMTQANVTLTGQNRSIRYGEQVPTAAGLFDVGGKPAAGDDVVFTAQYDSPVRNAGSYGATATFDAARNPNYAIQATPATLNVLPADAAVVITIQNAARAYGDADVALAATVDGLQDGDSLDYTLTREPGTGVGTYKITASVTPNANYTNVTVVDGTYTITKRPMVLVANSYTITEGAAVPALTAYMPAGYTLAAGDSTLVYTVYRPNTSTAPGAYEILIGLGDNPNYDIQTQAGTLTINAAAAPATNPAPAPADPAAPAAPAAPAGPAAPAVPDMTAEIVPDAVPEATVPDAEPAEPDLEVINEEPVPLGEYEGTNTATPKTWAVSNLVALILSIGAAVITIIGRIRKRRSGIRSTKQESIFSLFAVLGGIAAPTMFFLIGGITVTPVFMDNWTAAMGFILVLQVLATILAKFTQAKSYGDDFAD